MRAVWKSKTGTNIVRDVFINTLIKYFHLILKRRNIAWDLKLKIMSIWQIRYNVTVIVNERPLQV